MFLSTKLNYKWIRRRGFVYKRDSLLSTRGLKAGANTWAAVQQPQIPRIWGIWVGTPLLAASLLADLLCLSPPCSVPQEKDAEPGSKIARMEKRVFAHGGICRGVFGEGEGHRWGIRGHPWMLVRGRPSPHDSGTLSLKQGHQEGIWLRSSR